MKEHSEELLIGLALSKHDQRAFGQLVDRHQSMIRHSLRQLTNWDESLADDLAQETFIQAYQHLHQYNGQARFSSWLYRIAYNQFLQYCRKQKSKKRAAELEELNEEVLPAEHPSDRPDTNLHKQVANILAGLEPKRRCVLHLLLYRECSHQEIAQILQMPLGTVKTHIKRGRHELQQRLNQWQSA